MNGEIIYFDSERGTGFITGTDGNRYVFDRSDIAGDVRVTKGSRVTFGVEADRARGIVVTNARETRTARSVPEAGSPETPLSTSRGAIGEMPATPDSGMFGYFRRCIGSNYANFRGRARRKEFWSFAFWSFLILMVLVAGGIALDFAVGNMKQIASDSDFKADGGPWITAIVAGAAWLALIVPSIAVSVRRIHDIGLSGWFFLLNLIPSVGGLIIFVFMLIPSQRHDNKWGPVPEGIRI